VKSYPGNARLQYNYGLKIQEKDRSSSLSHFELAVKSQPNHAEANIALGRHLLVPPGSSEHNARATARKHFEVPMRGLGLVFGGWV